jgi:hypothetical protein
MHTTQRISTLIATTAVLAATVAAPVIGGVAHAGAPHSSIKITGPASVKLGKKIQMKASGYTGQATSAEVFLEVKGQCAKTAKAEPGKALVFGPFSKNRHFTFPLPLLTPGNPPTSLGKHSVCVFLTAPKAKKTYAHARFSYTVHS